MKTTIIRANMVLVAGAAFAGAVPSAAQAADVNLIVNGDFKNAATASTGSYTNCGTPGAYTCTTNNGSGNVFFANSANQVNGGFPALTDHSGNGSYLAVFDPNSLAPLFSQTFSVAANATYNVSFYAADLNYGVGLQASVNGVALGAAFVPGSGWTQFTSAYNSGLNTSVTFAIASTNPSYSYNDGALDDVSFVGPAAAAPASAVPEPATWAMTVAGFGLMGGALRRRGVSARDRRAVSFG